MKSCVGRALYDHERHGNARFRDCKAEARSRSGMAQSSDEKRGKGNAMCLSVMAQQCGVMVMFCSAASRSGKVKPRKGEVSQCFGKASLCAAT